MARHPLNSLIPIAALALLVACDTGPSDDDQANRGDDVPTCSDQVPGFECEGSSDGSLDNGDDGDDGGEDGSESSDEGCGETDHGETETGDDEDEADLPYALEVDVGDVVDLADAFAEKGPQPAAVLEITMDDGDWRLDELQAGTPFVVTQADCDHEGNRDEGRDRIFVTWLNADGSEDTDHLDLRYCGA